MSVKRYRPRDLMIGYVVDDGSEVVLASDYDALRAERDRIEAELDATCACRWKRTSGLDDATEQIGECAHHRGLQAEVARLRRVADEVRAAAYCDSAGCDVIPGSCRLCKAIKAYDDALSAALEDTP